MRKFIFVIVVFCVFLGGYLIKEFELDFSKSNNGEVVENIDSNDEINNANSSNIIERREMSTRKLFDLGDGITNYEIDLMQNDMIWNNNCALYHKIITNKDDYDKYDERLELPEVDLDKYFIVIVANENLKPADEVDLMIHDVTADETTTHIIMKQKENPIVYSSLPSGVTSSGRVYYSDNNVFWAVVDNSVLKENVNVVIEHE